VTRLLPLLCRRYVHEEVSMSEQFWLYKLVKHMEAKRGHASRLLYLFFSEPYMKTNNSINTTTTNSLQFNAHVLAPFNPPPPPTGAHDPTHASHVLRRQRRPFGWSQRRGVCERQPSESPLDQRSREQRDVAPAPKLDRHRPTRGAWADLIAVVVDFAFVCFSHSLLFFFSPFLFLFAAVFHFRCYNAFFTFSHRALLLFTPGPCQRRTAARDFNRRNAAGKVRNVRVAAAHSDGALPRDWRHA